METSLRFRFTIVAWAISLIFTAAGFAKIIYVDDDGPADFSRIQVAIDAAGPGDTVKVAPGTYREAVRMRAGVSLQGAGPADTVIDVPTHLAVVTGADDCRLDGFTVTGYIDDDIDGVYCQDVNNFTVSNNVIKDCTWSGINAIRSAVVVRNNIICGNRCAGIFLTYPSATRSVIVNNTIWDNANEADVTIWRGAEALVANNIMEDIDCDGESSAKILYNDIAAQAVDANNIHVDPLFAHPNAGDWHLKSREGRWDPGVKTWVQDEICSPCIDAGDPNSPIGDEPAPNGGRINMGAYGGTRQASKSCLNYPPRKVIYVDGNAAGANDGTSWADAYKHLQAALADADESAKPVEIRVGGGVYRPDQGRATRGANPREFTFSLAGGVTLRGGYAGPGEADPNARDVRRYRTILSGDLKGNDADLTDPLLLMGHPTRTDNSYHIVTVRHSPAGPAVLDSFTVTGGNGEDNDVFPCFSPIRHGGGLHSNADGQDGSSDVIVIDCSFEANSSGQSGGAIYHRAAANLTVIGCEFKGNYAANGGAIEVDGMLGGTANLASCVLADNRARYGGAVYATSVRRTALTGCTLRANRAGRGGAVLVQGPAEGGPHVFDAASCLFAGNWADRHPWTVAEPQSPGGAPEGGAIVSQDEELARGGAVYIAGPTEGHWTQCTFASNSAQGGSSLACDSNAAPSRLELGNCIVWDDGNQIWNADGSMITVGRSDVRDLQSSTYDPYDGLLWGSGNIDADPSFADPGHWDDNGTPENLSDDVWVDGDYHLKSQAGRWDPVTGTWVLDDVTSPCIDAGDPNSPIGDEPVPNGGRINMGAYGGTCEASKSWLGGLVLGVITLDATYADRTYFSRRGL